TACPAFRSADATVCLPRQRSTKNVVGLCGFKLQLAADCLFYLQTLTSVVCCELFDGVATLVALSNESCGDPRARQDRPPEREAGIYHHSFWFFGGAFSGEWIKANGPAGRIPLNTSQVGDDEFSHRDLSSPTDIDELPVLCNEQV